MADSSAARPTPSAATPWFADAWREFLLLFSNIGFAVSLFAIWGFMTLLGVIVDQGKDASIYFQSYPAPIARAVLRLDLDNIYHSTGYVTIIGLILVSMTVATFYRVIPARLPALRPVKIEAIPLNASVRVKGTGAEVTARVEAFFAERGWTLRKREFGGAEWVFADKFDWARRGVLIAHVGFVVIAAGTTIYWARGFSGTTTILSGATQRVAQTDATIKVNAFNYDIKPMQTKSGIVYQPLDYVSYLTVTDRNGKTSQQTLRVNHPIDVNGTLFYQSSYGYAIDVAATKDGVPLPGLPLDPIKEGTAFQLGQSNRAVQYAQFVGTIDRATNSVGRDPRPNDPGVVLAIYDGDQVAGRVLVPIGTSVDLGNGYRVGVMRYTVYTGLQYRYDPGIPLVGIGAFILLLGLCVSFYFLPARLYVRVQKAGEGSEGAWDVGLAATTVKGYDIFEERFEELARALSRDFGQREPALARAH
jgi:cytochrome c biogenesis protein